MVGMILMSMVIPMIIAVRALDSGLFSMVTNSVYDQNDRQHCRLSIWSNFNWVLQILNLRRAGLSIAHSQQPRCLHKWQREDLVGKGGKDTKKVFHIVFPVTCWWVRSDDPPYKHKEAIYLERENIWHCDWCLGRPWFFSQIWLRQLYNYNERETLRGGVRTENYGISATKK